MLTKTSVVMVTDMEHAAIELTACRKGCGKSTREGDRTGAHGGPSSRSGRVTGHRSRRQRKQETFAGVNGVG